MQSCGDGGEFSDGMREEVGVLCHARVALSEAASEVVD